MPILAHVVMPILALAHVVNVMPILAFSYSNFHDKYHISVCIPVFLYSYLDKYII